MAKLKGAKLAASLRRQGFDRSYVDRSDGNVEVRCSQCAVLVINGVACHEAGCPNFVRREED